MWNFADIYQMAGDLASYTPKNEGEVSCVVVSNVRTKCNAQIIRQILGSFGDISSFKTQTSAQYFTVLCEFYDARHAQEAINVLDDEIVDVGIASICGKGCG